MHLTSAPFVTSPSARGQPPASSDDQILRTLMEADDVVRMLLLDYLCDGDEARRDRLAGMVEAALSWRSTDCGARPGVLGGGDRAHV